MKAISNLLSSRMGPVIAGIFIGSLAVILVILGNPGNMGICAACFVRDTSGALGLHRAAAVQYIRPEIIGFLLGSFVAALTFKEFKPRAGSSPVIRFFLGFFAMIGALVFLGCPWRAILRLSAGDLNAIVGIIGLVAGIYVGILFLKNGFSLGRNQSANKFSGLIMPAVMTVLLILLVLSPKFGRDATQQPIGPIFISTTGPGSMYAPLIFSLLVGLIVGFLAQRTRFCTVGAFRDVLLIKDFHLFNGLLAFFVSALIFNFIFGKINIGFANQPIAHSDGIWNFLGMSLSGLAYTLAGGCPGRQIFLSGEGDGDASIFVLGMFIGAAFSHNFNLASSPAGASIYGPYAVIAGLAFCLIIGIFMKDKR